MQKYKKEWVHCTEGNVSSGQVIHFILSAERMKHSKLRTVQQTFCVLPRITFFKALQMITEILSWCSRPIYFFLSVCNSLPRYDYVKN